MKDKNVLNSPRLNQLKRKKQRAARRKVSLCLLLFLVVFFGLAFISRIHRLNIKEVSVSGNQVVENAVIKEIVQTDLAGKYLGLFPRTNFLLYPKNKIKSDLEKRIKRLENISFDLKKNQALEISVSEYEGEYLWCGVSVPTLPAELKEPCYFMDSNGYLFDQAPYFSGKVYFKFYGPVNNPAILGSYFLPDSFANLVSFKKNLELMNLKPTALGIEANGEGNFFLVSVPIIGPKIIFKLDADFGEIAENLKSALDTEPLHTDFIKKFSSLLYLDLRFSNKVYYKFK